MDKKFWKKLCDIHNEVHLNTVKIQENTLDIETVSNHLMNHLTNVDKRTNVKLVILGITVSAAVGLLAIFK